MPPTRWMTRIGLLLLGLAVGRWPAASTFIERVGQPSGASGLRSASSGTPGGVLDVREAPYLAQGDGQADDGPAIQQALDDSGAAGGGVVFLPAGNYRVNTHLRIPAHVSLVGVFRAAPNRIWDSVPTPNPMTPPALVAGTTLLVYEGQGSANGTPFVTLAGDNATVDGVAFYYPEQTATNPPVAYPFTIGVAPNQGGALKFNENVTVQNVLLWNSFDGIDLASAPSIRHSVRDVLGFPLHIGLKIDKCYDVGKLSNVHFNTVWSTSSALTDYVQAHGTAFVFYRTDGELVDRLFAHGYRVGIRLSKAPAPDPYDNGTQIPPTVAFSNVNIEESSIGVDVYETGAQGILFSNFLFDSASGDTHTVIGVYGRPNFYGNVTLTGPSFWGKLTQAVRWEGLGNILINGARFQMVNNNTIGKYAVAVIDGQATLQNSVFLPQTCTSQPCTGVFRGLWAANTADGLIFTGNLLNGFTYHLQAPQFINANNLP